jgi:hypothetical protein
MIYGGVTASVHDGLREIGTEWAIGAMISG